MRSNSVINYKALQPAAQEQPQFITLHSGGIDTLPQLKSFSNGQEKSIRHEPKIKTSNSKLANGKEHQQHQQLSINLKSIRQDIIQFRLNKDKHTPVNMDQQSFVPQNVWNPSHFSNKVSPSNRKLHGDPIKKFDFMRILSD